MLKIGKTIDAIGDWVHRGSDAASMAKFLSVCGVVIGVVATPFAYLASVNENELDDVIRVLDRTPHSVFASVDRCIAGEFSRAACEEAKERAENFANSLGSGLVYLSSSACTKNHSVCSESTTTTTINVGVGNGTSVPVTSTLTTYHPSMVAWQMVNNNPSLSVPLYTSTSPNNGVRKDGRVFALE